jgi:hypothetical protein
MSKKKRSVPEPLAREIERRATEAAERNRIEAMELVRRIEACTANIAGATYDIGEALSKLREKRLYSAIKHASFEDLVAERFDFSRAQAYRFIAIAQRLTRSRASELGPRRAVALLRLADATPGLDSVEDLLREGVKIQGRKGPVSVSDLRVEELERAAQAVLRAHRSPQERVSGTEQKEAEAFAVRLRERLRVEGASGCRVEIRRRARADAPEALTIRIDIPYSARAALTAALRRK